MNDDQENTVHIKGEKLKTDTRQARVKNINDAIECGQFEFPAVTHSR